MANGPKKEQEIQRLARIAEIQKELRLLKETYDETEMSAEDFAKASFRLNQELKAQEEALNKVSEANTDLLDTLEAVSDALTGISSKWKSGSVGAALYSDAIGKIEKSSAAAGVAVNTLGSLTTSMIQTSLSLTTALDEATVAFNKSTGMASKFADQMANSESALRGLGVSVGQVGQSYTDLANNFGQFTDLSASQQESIANTNAVLDKFTGGAFDLSANLGLMTAGMNMSAEAASNLQAGMFNFLQDAGLPTSKILGQFEQHRSTMMKFGDQSVDVFLDLAVSAHKSNIELGQLISIIEQFDQFDSAAKSVGELNALLGGPFLNTIEMVSTTDPIERMRMLQGAVLDAGKSFDDMEYYERQAIASAMGLKDAGELALVMAGNFDHLAGSAEMNQQQYLDLANQNREFNSVMEELDQTMKAFAVTMLPVVQGFKFILDLVNNLPEPIRKTIGVMLGLGAAGMLLVKVFSGLGLGAAAAGGGGLAAGLTALGAAAPALGPLAVVMLAIGAGVAIATGAIALLVYAMSDLTGSLAELSGDQFIKASSGVSQLAAAITELPVAKSVMLKTVFDSAAAYESVAQIGTATLGPTATATGQTKASNVKVVNNIKFLLDGREMGQYVDERIDNKLKAFDI